MNNLILKHVWINDSHYIYDAKANTWTNPFADVKIESHV